MTRNSSSTDDLKGARGGDTGPTKQKGKGTQAEKGDQRRETPTSSAPTRPGSQGTASERGKRSGSESAAEH